MMATAQPVRAASTMRLHCVGLRPLAALAAARRLPPQALPRLHARRQGSWMPGPRQGPSSAARQQRPLLLANLALRGGLPARRAGVCCTLPQITATTAADLCWVVRSGLPLAVLQHQRYRPPFHRAEACWWWLALAGTPASSRRAAAANAWIGGRTQRGIRGTLMAWASSSLARAMTATARPAKTG